MTAFEEWADIEALVREAERLPRLSQDLRRRVLTRAQRRRERWQAIQRLAVAASLLFCVGQLTLWMQPAAELVTPQVQGRPLPVPDDLTEWGVVDSVIRSRVEHSRTMLSLF
jgi:ferric-dicitrate binding protein FerR (iron transport regulator)